MPNVDHAETRDHVRVGDIYISPHGMSESMYVDMGGWLFRIDESVALAMLDEMGVKVARHGWSSWQHDDWNIENDEVIFDKTTGQATPTPRHWIKRVPVLVMMDALLQSVCLYRTSDEGKVLKNCQYCVYGMAWHGNVCIRSFAEWISSPVVHVVENAIQFIRAWANNEWESGQIGAMMQFTIKDPTSCIPTRWESLKRGLRSTHGQPVEDDGRFTYTKHYACSDGIEYSIVLDPATFTGFIEAIEESELSSAEDWLCFKSYQQSKQISVLKAFAELSWWSHGHIAAKPRDAIPRGDPLQGIMVKESRS